MTNPHSKFRLSVICAHCSLIKFTIRADKPFQSIPCFTNLSIGIASYLQWNNFCVSPLSRAGTIARGPRLWGTLCTEVCSQKSSKFFEWKQQHLHIVTCSLVMFIDLLVLLWESGLFNSPWSCFDQFCLKVMTNESTRAMNSIIVPTSFKQIPNWRLIWGLCVCPCEKFSCINLQMPSGIYLRSGGSLQRSKKESSLALVDILEPCPSD